MQLVPGTTPKGKSMTRNQILAKKQLLVDEMDLVPVVKIAIDRDLSKTPTKLPPHPSPNSNGQVEISQDPAYNDYWALVTNQEDMKTRETFDQKPTDALLCRQLLNIE